VIVEQGVESAVRQLRILKHTPPSSEDWAEALVNSPRVHHIIESVTTILPISLGQLSETCADLLRGISNRVTEWLGDLLTRLPGLAMELAVVVISLYFFLMDGRRLIMLLRRHSFFSVTQTTQLLETLQSVCRSVILASLVSGICQALFVMTMVIATGTPEAVLIGTLVFIASFVPLVGTAPVTFGLAFHQMIFGRPIIGVVLLIAAFIVLAMDNTIRPWFLKGSANLHPLVTFSAAFGGLQMLGFSGIFLGPIVAALFVATLQVITEVEGGTKSAI
jgi:predicted PurR-regulated permease PerM